jgi:uncharacterized protein YkwD
MKKTLTILFVLITTLVSAQVIDYNNFDKKLFEKVLFNKLNEYRKLKGVEPLLWSETIYTQITTHQMKKMIKVDRLFHPDMRPMWDSLRVRHLIAKESDKLVGVKTSVSICSGASMTLYENAYWTVTIDGTYDDLAERAIKGWEKSYMHNATQYASFENCGKPGLAACTVGMTSRGVYVTFNFVRVYRKKEG